MFILLHFVVFPYSLNTFKFLNKNVYYYQKQTSMVLLVHVLFVLPKYLVNGWRDFN